MPAIPKTHQYYPIVPLSELSDLYSKGDNRLDGERICIISFLPKTLRISESLPFNNKYLLYIENTANVTEIDWGYQLFNNGASINLDPFLEETTSINRTEYNLLFYESIVDAGGQPVADKIIITCTVTNGASEIVLSVEHSFVKTLNSTGLVTADETKKQTLAFAGDPNPTNYILNHIKDYLQESTFTWNNTAIDIDLSSESTLLKIVTSIIYYNVEIASNNSPIFPFYFDINEYKSVGIENYINGVIPSYEGNYVNGICRIPLHILSDVMPNVTEAPDYTKINEGNGNPIFNVMRDAGLMTYNDLLGDVLRTVPQQIQDSKLRLKNNESKLIELFNLTLFPKSAIKLTAILVKYLFESSKLNNCNECLSSSPQWPTISLDDLKNHPYFLRNILTHYFREPINSIKSYAVDAIKATSLVWSPAIYLVVNAQSRITKANFSRKIVTNISPSGVAPVLVYEFVRIDDLSIRVDENGVRRQNQPTYDAIIGGHVYLVIETLHCRNKEITVNIKPESNVLTGDLNNLDIKVGTQNVYLSDITKVVGNHDDLHNNNNNDFSDDTTECFNIDHRDKAIIKIRLTPDTSAGLATHLLAFNDWVNRLAAQTVNLLINVKLSDDSYSIFGNDVLSNETNGEFLNGNDYYNQARFRVVNRIGYEIYHADSEWNFNPLNGADRIPIGKIQNTFVENIANGSPDIGTRNAIYKYYDQYDGEHIFGEFQITRINEWRPTPPGPNPAVQVYLVEATELDEYNERGVHINFMTDNSPRDYIDLERFAGLIGAMAVNNIFDLGYNGFSHADGSPTPSSSHRNGVNGDLRYLRTDNTGGPCILTQANFDYDRQVNFNNSLNDYGWGEASRMLSEEFLHAGNPNTILPHTRHFHRIRVDVSYHSEDQVVNNNFPQIITNNPNGGVLNVGDVISIVDATHVNISGLIYQVNANRVIVNPLPAGATLAAEIRIRNPVRHNNHLHLQGFDDGYMHELIQ